MSFNLRCSVEGTFTMSLYECPGERSRNWACVAALWQGAIAQETSKSGWMLLENEMLDFGTVGTHAFVVPPPPLPAHAVSETRRSAVARGAQRPPRLLVIARWSGESRREPLAQGPRQRQGEVGEGGALRARRS